MTPQMEPEQMCEVGMITLLPTEKNNGVLISAKVEETYQNLHHRAKAHGKILVGVSQTINTECDSEFIVYILTLVGTVVDAELLKQQQRLQQFDPRAARPH